MSKTEILRHEPIMQQRHLSHSFVLPSKWWTPLSYRDKREEGSRTHGNFVTVEKNKNHRVDANDVSRWYIYLRLDKSVACLPSYSSFHTHQTQTQIERKEHAYKPERKGWTWTIKTDTRHDDRVKFKRKWTLRLKEIESVNLFRKIGNESDDSKAQKVFECQLPWSSSSWIDYCYHQSIRLDIGTRWSKERHLFFVLFLFVIYLTPSSWYRLFLSSSTMVVSGRYKALPAGLVTRLLYKKNVLSFIYLFFVSSRKPFNLD